MLGALFTFLVLFGLIKVFERGREDLDSGQVAMVAIVPVLVVLGLLYPDPLLLLILPALALLGVTFVLLHKNLEIPVGRSIGYTLAAFVANEVAGFILFSM